MFPLKQKKTTDETLRAGVLFKQEKELVIKQWKSALKVYSRLIRVWVATGEGVNAVLHTVCWFTVFGYSFGYLVK